MKVLVIGSGGREHAIAWKLSQSRHVDKVYCTPGNAGIAEIAECIDVDLSNFDALLDLVRYEWIDLTIVGPEDPLSRGIVDYFEKDGRRILGPTKAAAQLESSKVFSKEFMKRHRIPTAEYKVFTSYLHAEDYVRMKGAPIVIKADGLAAGKGVIVASTVDEATDALRLIMKDRAFGDAGNRAIVEECLKGEEASFMVFTDGETIVPMVSSQDHKRIFDDDKGPNTGGMGAYSPAPVITKELESVVMDTIMRPTIEGLKSEGIKYKGILYAGLMIDDGNPYVLEFNCRLGDPETQPILSRLDTDLVDISMAITDEKLSDMDIEWKDEASVCVVLSSKGYPGKYEKGKVISGLNDVKKMDDVVVFHAGTAFNNNEIITNGGRVLGVTALGKDIKTAKDRAYEAVKKIHFDGMHYRKDIADKALKCQ
ncbi:MAG: phosphoribosylamine--glycine ligase [Nitrospirae bacterium]|nr:phosphoribosylamine--glycine ligase [Nitrospirota bacterium]MDA8215065.1 phosphoribosylamine--glycine ligase [Nitrospiraceae bacterium]MDA8339570.1 phosphoribosylamine--glycine ligase [Nitrospiraceae bacterium]